MSRLFAALFVAMSLGCSNLNYQKSWKQPPPPESLTTRGTRVRIVDARPNWEQKPFRDAIVLHALDEATPPVWDQLEAGMIKVADELAERPERIEVTVQSIQLVTKDPVKLAEEAENQRKFRSEPDENAGILEMLQSFLIGIPLELVLNAPFEKKYPPGLGESPDGTSCAFQADVTITWPGGRKRTIPVSALATTDQPGEPREARVGLSAAVQMATFQVGDQLRNALKERRSP
jgi:hypothetical protein